MADTRRITVTEGLRELKLYDSKIAKAMQCAFVGATKKSLKTVGTTNREDFIDSAKASYQSVKDLIENRARLKAAIAQSNAETKVEIGGVTYTVAQAIEKKTSIAYEQELLDQLSLQYSEAKHKVINENLKVDNTINQMLSSFLGNVGDKKISEAEMEVISKPYREKNEYELVDPLGVEKVINDLREKIDAFLAEVDVRLSVINSITYIEV